MNNLYKINDVLNESFIRLPLAIIANPKYRGLSSDAKILYSLLCNRLRLSQLNNWVNDNGEVYLIYTREQAAKVLGISYKTAIKTFKELIGIGLLFEERRGKSLANHLYLSKPEECDIPQTNDFNEVFDKPFAKKQEEPCKDNTLKPQNMTCKNDISQSVSNQDTGPSDVQKLHIKTCKNYSSRPVKCTHPDMSNLQASKKELINKDLSDIESNSVYQTELPVNSICQNAREYEKIDMGLTDIIENCELDIFDDDVRNIYESAIERLYYSEIFKIGNAVIPQDKIRSYLTRLDSGILFGVHQTLCKNTTRIKNPIGYVMSMIINAVCESNIELYAYGQALKSG